MIRKISIFSTLIVCFYISLAQANTIGFGLGGGWGLNLMGFSGKSENQNSKFSIGQLLSFKSFIEYSFGEDGREEISLALDLGFMQRTIEADFANNDNNKSKTYTIGEKKIFTIDCIEAIVKVMWNPFQFEYGVWGPYVGLGSYYMLRGALTNEDVEATQSQYNIVETNLDKLNIFVALGLQTKFLDRILAITAGSTYSFLNQIKPEYVENSIKNNYGNNVSVGKGQIGILAELKIDIWQIIIG